MENHHPGTIKNKTANKTNLNHSRKSNKGVKPKTGQIANAVETLHATSLQPKPRPRRIETEIQTTTPHPPTPRPTNGFCAEKRPATGKNNKKGTAP